MDTTGKSITSRTAATDPAGQRHTTGPWRADITHRGVLIAAERGDFLRLIDDSPRAEAEANARLIAAAPDYHEHAYHLAILVLQSTLYSSDADVREQVDHVLAIHAKAAGQA